MMFELFMFFVAFAVVMFLAGFHFENYPLFMVSGIIFLLLATGVLGSGLTLQTGEIITQETQCPDFVNDTCVTQGTYNLTTTVSYVYTSSGGVGNAVLVSFLFAMTFFSFACAVIFATPKKDQ